MNCPNCNKNLIGEYVTTKLEIKDGVHWAVFRCPDCNKKIKCPPECVIDNKGHSNG